MNIFRQPLSALALLPLLASFHASAQTSVGVSVDINQPGVYGRIDIGNRPPPPIVYAQPLIIARPAVVPQPVYLYVPPGHQKNWRKHCGKYNACGQPVYFVKESWVRQRYEEAHRDDPGHGHGKKDKHGKGHGKGNGKGGKD